jgi:hypothetical protein
MLGYLLTTGLYEGERYQATMGMELIKPKIESRKLLLVFFTAAMLHIQTCGKVSRCIVDIEGWQNDLEQFNGACHGPLR